jgi:hypothetical protein
MPRSGDLHVIKECSEYAGLPGQFCTITSSNLEEIVVGARVIYAEAPGETTLDTDVTLEQAQATPRRDTSCWISRPTRAP